jgi:tape measure domain-containing protein
MSKVVDNKVVSMSMDNSDLLNKSNQSMKALTGLDSGLNKVKGVDMSKTSSSLSKVSGALDESSSHGSKLAQMADTIKNRFSTMGVIAATAVQNLTNRVVNAGLQMAKSFTVAPIAEGFNMYQDKLKAIQVMLSNTQGKSSIGDITKSLGELNNYANKTVYSFQDMTTNMGTFTAAGVDLKTAQDAIQGIGNLAASSGSNTQQAGMAMYQLSQAIAAGKVGLQDWNSVVNAGMGGKKFQTALQQNAKAMGKNVDATKSFRDSLQDGWLTTDVLMKTLRQFKNDKSMQEAATQSKTFSDAMDTLQDQLKSGWANTWEALIGDYTVAPKIWTAFANGVGDMINKSAEARTKLVSDFVALGGRSQSINVLVNGFHFLQDILQEVTKGFHDVFPPVTAKNLYDIVSALNIFIARAMGANKTLDALRGISRGFFSVLDLGIKSIGAVAKILLTFIPSNLIPTIIQVAGSIGNLIYNFDKGMNSGSDFSKMLDNIHKSVNNLFDGLVNAVKKAGGFIDIIIKIGSTIAKWVEPYFSAAAKAVGNFIKSFTFGDLLGAGGVGSLIVIASSVSKFRKAVSDLFDKFTGFLQDASKSSKAFSVLTDSLKNLTTAFKAATLVEIAAAVVAIAVALKLLSKLSFTDIAKGLEVVLVSLLAMTKTLNAIGKMKFNGGAFQAAALIFAISNSIIILAGALKILAGINATSLGKALIALAATITLLVAALTVLSKAGGKMAASSFQIQAIAVSVLILSGALKILSMIPASSLAKSILALGAVFVELAGFILLVNKQKLSPSASLGVLVIANAMVIMAGGLAIMSKINANSLLKALVAMAIVLSEIALFANAMKSTGVIGAAVGVTAVAVAIDLMAPALLLLGKMSLEAIGHALTIVGGALAEIVLAMKGAKGSLSGAVAITIVATALNILVIPLKVLGSMSLAEIAKGLGALAGTFVIVAVAAKLIGVGGSVALLAFAAAIGAVGVALGGIGLVITAFTLALTTLAAMTTAQLNNVVKSFTTLLKGLQSIIPLIVAIGVTLVVQLAAGLAKGIPAIAQSALQIIQGFLQAISDHIYQIASLGIEIVTKLINAIASKVGDLVNAGVNLIVKFISGMANGIREHSKELVNAMFSLVESLLEVMVDALVKMVSVIFGWIPGVQKATAGLGTKAKEALRGAFQVKDVGSKGGQDFSDGVNGKSGSAKNAGKNLSNSAHSGASTNLSGEGSKGGSTFNRSLSAAGPNANAAGRRLNAGAHSGSSTNLSGEGSKAGSTFNSSLRSHGDGANTAGSKLKNGARKGAKTDLTDLGSAAGSGFNNGLGSWVDSVMKSASNLAGGARRALEKALRTGSPSRVTHQIGQYFSQGFANGIQADNVLAVKQSESLADQAIDAIQSVGKRINDALNDSLDMQPTITPVLDLSGIQNASLNMQSAIKLPNGLNSLYSASNAQPATQSVTFGTNSVVVNITAADAQTAEQTMDLFRSRVQSVLVDEVRKIKKVN